MRQTNGSAVRGAHAGGTGQTSVEGIPALDRAFVRREALSKRADVGQARREGQPLLQRTLAVAKWLVAELNAFRPMRVWTVYSKRHGPLMAAGTAYRMFFSIAALLVAGFSIFGLIAAGNKELQDLVVDTVARSTPGLIATDTQPGLATAEELFDNSSSFGWALAISTATMLITALGWIKGIREGMRGVFGLATVEMNPVVAKARDLGILVLMGIGLVLTSAVGFVAGAALDWILNLLGIASVFGQFATRVVSLLVMLLLDMLVAVVLFRLASSINMPQRALWEAALIAGGGATVLRFFSSQLLGSVGQGNDLLAPFAVILGLFVWFFLLSQVYLIAASWGAVRTGDIEAAEAAAGGARLTLRQRAALKKAQSAPEHDAGWAP
ncbi:YihY/virulence factor BrkB family protein [Zhihengliuella flava]|uniref:Membrane protein n=1 Tax=Zhihengliuella flava TaxID=1285193 RepID=A0A931DBW4_9MICC|nr:YihY/virulence factor BrkB family protein [Zhihengliuella flava]MBG6084023.1 membrane protein [Zhihengliuella flava]